MAVRKTVLILFNTKKEYPTLTTEAEIVESIQRVTLKLENEVFRFEIFILLRRFQGECVFSLKSAEYIYISFKL